MTKQLPAGWARIGSATIYLPSVIATDDGFGDCAESTAIYLDSGAVVYVWTAHVPPDFASTVERARSERRARRSRK